MQIEEELQSLEMNKAWDLVEPPHDKHIMICKSVYKLKDTAGNIRYKARLVARGLAKNMVRTTRFACNKFYLNQTQYVK
jgi:hypothetical protein